MFYNNSLRLQHPISIMERSFIQKISKEIEDLNNTVDQLHLTDIHGKFHPTQNKHTSQVNMEHSPGKPYVRPHNNLKYKIYKDYNNAK